jgi:SAM-dependent methyltransferase
MTGVRLSEPQRIFDTGLLLRRKDRCAARGNAPDFLLARVADDIAERLQIVKRTFPVAACLGALNGELGRRLRALPGVGTVVDVESCARLLALCDGPRVLADEEALAFADGSLDLAVSGLTLHLVNDLPGTLVQIRRALKPDGLFLGALLGGETLKELREAWLIAESEIEGGASPRVAPFADVRDVGGLLQRAGLALPVADSERLTVTYASPLALMREIKAMGASNMLAARRRKPVTRGLLRRATEVYTERFGLPNGRVPATFEILTVTAWAPHDSQQKPLRPGSSRTRLAEALGVKEHKP